MSNRLDQNMIENIKNYSNEIITLETFVKAVRQMPGMYIGGIGNRGFLNMFREVFQNAVDELMKKSSPCTLIKVSYDERTHMFIIEDNGRGIPFNDMIRVYTEEHTGSNYVKKKREFSSGLHGVGAKVTNALCSLFTVESYILGEARKVEFIDGVPSEKGIYIIPNKDNKQGTVVTFVPCFNIMGNLTLTGEEVLSLVKMIISLTDIGSMVHFNCIRKDGTTFTHKIVNEDGILSNLIYMTKKPLIAPITISEITDDKKADIMFTYDSNDLSEENIVAFSNFCPTIGGTHIKGFMDGITKFFKDYMNKVYLVNNKKLTVNNTDVKTGLRAIVTVSHLKPIFSGQAKDELSNEDMEGFVKDLVVRTLTAWSQSTPGDLQKVARYLKEIAEIRVKSEEGRIKLTSQYQSSALSGLPAKYTKPSGKEDLELIIVEGLSAGGGAKNGRCPKRQGIYPIRGKILNAFSTPKEKFLSNPEVAGIITIVGGGYGKNFDISKVPFKRIIPMADADADGAHIHVLLLSLFLIYMTPLVQHGYVFKAVPPLYGIKGRNGKFTYFTTKVDYVTYVQKQFSKNNKINTISGLIMTDNDVIDLLYRNIDYVYEIERIANTYAVQPELLELVLINRNKGFDALKGVVESKFRFMEVYKNDKTIIMNGLINSRSQRLFLNERLLFDSTDIIDYVDNINNGIMFYHLNGEPRTIYEIMKEFESNNDKMTRYKGLGEMDPSQLRESALHPESNRTLIQYTVEDIKKEIEVMRNIQSNKAQLINTTKLARHEIIG